MRNRRSEVGSQRTKREKRSVIIGENVRAAVKKLCLDTLLVRINDVEMAQKKESSSPNPAPPPPPQLGN